MFVLQEFMLGEIKSPMVFSVFLLFQRLRIRFLKVLWGCCGCLWRFASPGDRFRVCMTPFHG